MIADIDLGAIRRLADLHAVYRMFDGEGHLLYVGMTGHARRFDDHGVKRWFPAVATITLEWHSTEASARVAERRIIETEHPRYNLACTPRNRSRVIRRTASPSYVLADVLEVIGSKTGMQWPALAAELAKRHPDRWAEGNASVVSAQCRTLGVPSVDVKTDGRVLKGCRRADAEMAQLRVADRATSPNASVSARAAG